VFYYILKKRMKIALINKRKEGSLFHYAHFLIDCVYPEVINEIYKYKTVTRIKSIDQTLGNFAGFYENIMGTKTTEISEAEFNKLDIKPIILPPKEHYADIENLTKFRNYIFGRYSINSLNRSSNYPKVLLIKRGGRRQLINDPDLQKINKNVTTGKERREIKQIERVEHFLSKKYGADFRAVYLENKTFEEQVNLFHHAQLIVMAHGAATSTILFCKPYTVILEVSCGMNFHWFNECFHLLKINYLKIAVNEPEIIINNLKKINI
jgi:hypothetical protein